MIDELGTIISSFLAGSSTKKSKRVKRNVSIFIGLLFMLINLVKDFFQNSDITFESISVLFLLSLMLGLITYFILTISMTDKNTKR